MRRLAANEKRELVKTVGSALGRDRWHVRSWRGYLDTLDFYEDSGGAIVAVRVPQVMKTVYVPSGPGAPTDEDGARRYWIEDNLAHARASLPSEGRMLLRPVRDGDSNLLFEELVPVPGHDREVVDAPDESAAVEFAEIVDAIYSKFSAKLARAWDRYGSLVLTAP